MSGTTKPRARARPGPRGGPKGAPRPASRGAPGGPLVGWRRWAWVAALVGFVLIGLPLAHALFGEVAALLGGVLLLGFLLGRWTAR